MSKGNSSSRYKPDARFGADETNDQTDSTISSSIVDSSDSLVDCHITLNDPSLPGGDMNSVPHEDILCQPSTSSSNCPNDDLNDSSYMPMLALPAPPLMSAIDTSVNLDENGHRYVGLVNQAMTCYLNSLLQTLYMTPEFRNAIYRWKFMGSEESEARSIPFQLQKLFVLLQTCNRDSLETRDLTASFGWSTSEAYEQHDIQEFCRIMFDALKQKWSKTEKSFHDLYRGSLQDFVKCLFCKKENVKDDEFLDLPLAIRHYGATDAFKSVEEALHAFIKPEVLEGSNQYNCDQCGTKRDALKGLRIIKFPYLLSIQLKRFDFDYNTLHRIKLNDKMTFPMLLDLNEFVHVTTAPPSAESPKMNWASVVADSKRNTEDEKTTSFSSINYVTRAENSDGHVDMAEAKTLIEKDGPYVYELFSVMVHQGSAAGGHYFAYIKNLDQDRWFCFNDTNVTAATVNDIHRTFGGSTGGWSSGNTNAYMLMYRQIDLARNEKFMKTSELEDYLRQCLKRFEEQEKEKLKLKQYKDSLITVNVMLNNGLWLGMPSCDVQTIKVPYSSKLVDIFKLALDLFSCSEPSLIYHIRMLQCKDFTYSIMRAFSNDDIHERSLVDVFPECISKTYYRPIAHFMLDIKPPDVSEFYKISSESNVITVKVMSLNIETSLFSPTFMIQLHENENVAMIKSKIASMCAISADEAQKLRLVVDKGIAASRTMVLLDNDAFTCGKIFGTLSNITIYVDASSSGELTDEDRTVEFGKSRMFAFLDRLSHAKILTIKLPLLVDYKEAGLIPPTESSSRSVTPQLSMPMRASNFTWSDIGIKTSGVTGNDLLTAIVKSRQSSTSSDVEQDNRSMEADGDLEMSSASETCMRMISPVVSDNEETSKEEAADAVERMQCYESTFDAVLATSAQRVVDSERPDEKTSQADLSIVGSETHASTIAQNNFDAIILNRIRDDTRDEMDVNIDGRHTVAQLKEWVASLLSVDVNHFILMKHYSEDDDEGYESIANDTEQVHTAYYAIKKLSVKLQSPLKENERLLRIVRFDLDSNDQESWPILFSMAVTVDTQIRAVLMKCCELLEAIYVQKYDIKHLRLRDMIMGVGAPMMNPSDVLGRRGQEWNRRLYLQMLADDEIGKIDTHLLRAYPVMVRRWKPSVLEVSPITEVLVPYDRPDPLIALKEQIAILAHTTPKQIMLSDPLPANMWTRWPYFKDRIELLELPFNNNKVSLTGTFNGKLLYYKLADDKSRVLSEEEKRSIRIKDNATKASEMASCRRRERPLKIQLSTDNMHT